MEQCSCVRYNNYIVTIQYNYFQKISQKSVRIPMKKVHKLYKSTISVSAQ